MTCDLVALSIDANDPQRVADFWAGVLGWEVDGSGDVIGLLPPDDTGFRLRFPARALEPKVGPNQFHFDLTSRVGRSAAGDRGAGVCRSAGGTTTSASCPRRSTW